MINNKEMRKNICLKTRLNHATIPVTGGGDSGIEDNFRDMTLGSRMKTGTIIYINVILHGTVFFPMKHLMILSSTYMDDGVIVVSSISSIK